MKKPSVGGHSKPNSTPTTHKALDTLVGFVIRKIEKLALNADEFLTALQNRIRGTQASEPTPEQARQVEVVAVALGPNNPEAVKNKSVIIDPGTRRTVAEAIVGTRGPVTLAVAFEPLTYGFLVGASRHLGCTVEQAAEKFIHQGDSLCNWINSLD